MPTAKLTIKRGSNLRLSGVVVAGGSAEAQSDTMTLNIDVTNLSKGEALLMIEGIKQKIAASRWPLV